MPDLSKQLSGVIDVDAETGPDVYKERLYQLWEEGNWSARGLDFRQDALDWREKMSEEQQRSFLWNLSMFLDGEESVTVTLAPFMEAVPRLEDKVFLATQIADEARHHVFFDRFLREVCGIGHDLGSTLAETRPSLTYGYRKVFGELDLVAEQIRLHPRDLPLLAQGITLYHLVIEGMLAHTGQHFSRDFVERNALFPGFTQGIGMTTRDESRHIAFGIQLLRELVTTDAACKAAAIALLNRVLPWATGVTTPPGIDWTYYTVLGYTSQEVLTFGLRSLETKLRRAGINPPEVLELVKVGCDMPPAQQAERLIHLIEGRVTGTDEEPCVTELAMAALFDAMRDVAASTRPQHPNLRATLQWIFDDAQPHYLSLGIDNDEITTTTGTASHADLTLRCSATDWIRIVRGKLKQQRALLTGKLRVSGNLRLLLKLPQVLPLE